MDQQDESLTAVEQHPKAAQGDDGDRPDHCLNCAAELKGPYCSQCGQKSIPRRQTLKELVYNFLSSFSGYESKFFVTTKYLLLRPGFLANEYNEGKRERYFHPARMYVFISFVYFFLLSWIPSEETRSVVNVKSDSTTTDFFESQKSKILTRQQYDSAQAVLPEAARDGWLARKWNLNWSNNSIRTLWILRDG